MKTDFYFERFGFCERQIGVPAHPDLGIIVVIPCHDEPDLITSLNSLWACHRPSCTVEVIVVINSSINAKPDVIAQNDATRASASAWAKRHVDERFQTHILWFPYLPHKQSGVGLARKIGMDEALHRFHDMGSPNGVLCCFDADCTCDPNYLRSVESFFRHHPDAPGCSIYFEHPLDGPLDQQIYEAVMRYELHLRYYVQGLRFSEFPYAHHTVGSSMAVRAGVYRKQGGMNKRKAGEDFYFLHKVFPLGGFKKLTSTRVLPSPRPSHRVPFGTGKSVGDYLKGEALLTYPVLAFHDLKRLFQCVPEIHRNHNPSVFLQRSNLPESISSFLKVNHFEDAAKEILENTATEMAFTKRFFQWFNGFQVMRFIHHARDNFHGPGDLEIEPVILLSHLPPSTHRPNAKQIIRELLAVYRRLDRDDSNGLAL